jgi:RimJ/RimL family protein N-acetyltransferase
MVITLKERTEETVRTYFEKASTPEIRRVLPQKAQSVEEALADYEETLLPGATSYGRTILADGRYIGDVWCYCIDPEDEPNCMVSFCLFQPEYRSRGITTAALRLFLREISLRYGVKTVGAFTYAHNHASLKVLEKAGFSVMEEFEEDGVLSKYLQYTY